MCNIWRMKNFVTQIDKDKFQVIVDMKLYTKEVLTATCYKYTGSFYVHQESSAEVNTSVEVTLESKDGNHVSDIIAKQFCNDLIDQQVRYNTNLQFGHIRDLIVEEAFKPVNK